MNSGGESSSRVQGGGARNRERGVNGAAVYKLIREASMMCDVCIPVAGQKVV